MGTLVSDDSFEPHAIAYWPAFLEAKISVLFGQLWYFLFSSAMLAAFLLPPLALALRRGFACFYLEFLFISIWPGIIALITVQWLKRQGLAAGPRKGARLGEYLFRTGALAFGCGQLSMPFE